MKIVVIDGYTLNPGDLDISNLFTLGDICIYDRCSQNQIVKRLQNAEIAIVNKVIFDKEIIDQLPSLKFIAVSATGYNNLDISYLHKKGITVSNVSNYGSHAVAQHTFALILEIYNQVGFHQRACIHNKWSEIEDFCFWNRPLHELYGKKMGIVGLGNIGLQTAKIAKAFGMDVFYHSKHHKQLLDFQYVEDVNHLFSMSDIISLHCTLNEQTHHIIRKETLSHFQSSSILINTSRGGLICEEDLLNALNSGQIAGAGLDVLTDEPPKPDHALISHPKCIVTPHNAWAARETRQRLFDMVVENIKCFLAGKPINIVS